MLSVTRTPIPLPEPVEVAFVLGLGIATGVWVIRCYRRGWVKLNHFEKPFTRKASPVAFWTCIILFRTDEKRERSSPHCASKSVFVSMPKTGHFWKNLAEKFGRVSDAQ